MTIIISGTPRTITAETMIKRAYRILGETGIGETLTADQGSVGLDALNAMLDGFSIEKLMVYEYAQSQLTWPASTTSRTIGATGDFTVHRPDRIVDGTYFKDSNNIAYPVNVVRDRKVYDNIFDKTVTSSYPDVLFYDPTYPDGTLYVYPVPNQALTLYLNQWNPLQVFDSLTEAHDLPPGYERLIVYNMAVELEAETGLPCPPNAVRIASNIKKAIKRLNNIPTYSSTDVFYALKGHSKSDIVAGR